MIPAGQAMVQIKLSLKFSVKTHLQGGFCLLCRFIPRSNNATFLASLQPFIFRQSQKGKGLTVQAVLHPLNDSIDAPAPGRCALLPLPDGSILEFRLQFVSPWLSTSCQVLQPDGGERMRALESGDIALGAD